MRSRRSVVVRTARAPRPGSAQLSLLAKVGETAGTDVEPRFLGFVHRAVDRLAGRAAKRRGRGRRSLGGGGAGQRTHQFQDPEMSDGHGPMLLGSRRSATAIVRWTRTNQP